MEQNIDTPQKQDTTILGLVSRIGLKVFDLKGGLRGLESILYGPSLENTSDTIRSNSEGIKAYLSYIEEDIDKMSKLLFSIHKSL